MPDILQASPLTTADFSLMAYAQHMAETARSRAARQLFKSYLDHERRRLAKRAANHDPAGDAQGSRSEDAEGA